MGGYSGNNKLVRRTKPKAFHFDLPKNVNNNLKHEIGSIKKYNEHLAERLIKKDISQLFSIYKHRIEILKHRKQQNE